MDKQIDFAEPLSAETLPEGKEVTPQAKVQKLPISTRLAGVTFENRQEALSRCQSNDIVWLERESTNVYDHNAIRVTRNNGEMLGFVNRHLAAAIASTLDAYGLPIRGKVEQITGSGFDGFSLGIVISFRLPRLKRRRDEYSRFGEFYWMDD